MTATASSCSFRREPSAVNPPTSNIVISSEERVVHQIQAPACVADQCPSFPVHRRGLFADVLGLTLELGQPGRHGLWTSSNRRIVLLAIKWLRRTLVGLRQAGSLSKEAIPACYILVWHLLVLGDLLSWRPENCQRHELC